MANKPNPRRKTTTSTGRKTTSSAKKPAVKSTGKLIAANARPKAKPRNSNSVVKTKQPTALSEIIQQYKKQLKGTRVQVLDIPWEGQMIAKNLGIQRHPLLKRYIHEGLRIPEQLIPYASEDYSLDRWIEDSLNGFEKPVITKTTMKPREHQVFAIKKIRACAKAGWRGFVLADNVGVGKTIEAVYGASLVAQVKGFSKDRKAKLLVVAPKSALPHWRNTIKALGIENLRVVIINYDQTKKLLDPPASAATVKKTTTINQHITERGIPNVLWDIIIADESHKLKNDSQRTSVFHKIARYAVAATNAPFVIWASATVGQTPLELGYLSPLIGQIVGQNLNPSNWGNWLVANHFNVSVSAKGNFSWIKAKPENTAEQRAWILSQQQKDVERISNLLFSATAPSIRRNPEDISGWPTQTLSPTPLRLELEEKRLYDQAWREFRNEIGLRPRGKNPKGGLAATMRFRQKASLLSSIHTAEFANDLLDNGLQVLISVEFIETLDVIKNYLEKKGWHCAEISGRTDIGNMREEERLRFQRGEAQVVLFTVEEAISLHAGELLSDGTHATKAKRATIVHDIRYSGISMTQILGRGTRDGELANGYLMFSENTIEARILQVVMERMRNLKTLSGDDEDTLIAVQNVLDGLA